MRCVHLDFHTSPDIAGIGDKFDKQKFTETIKKAKVDLVTVFAKCHHGYTYYPSKVGTMHPGLKFNLLKEQIEAIHDAGAKAPIYITAGWCKKDADEHPEWHQIDFFTGKTTYMGAVPTDNDDIDAPLEHCSWAGLCLVGGYKKHLEAITREVCESFDVSDGIFYDICFFKDNCVCSSCR
ncbi:MAG: beta-galactosidase, partial [Clostridia bacterium]|nr:beta-galactosidase [Clostridia bacterium]